MNRMIFFFLPLLIVPQFVFAQSNEQVNYDKCEYDMITQNIYAPFYFHINHDSATSQKFIWHSDNPNVVPFTRSPGGQASAEQVTWFEFGSDVNATATYEFELDLNYLNKLDVPRPITMQLYSSNGLMMDRKIFQDDKTGCLAFKVSVTPEPHKFTSEEILSIAKLEFAGITKQYTDSITRYTDESNSLKTQLIVSNIVIFAVVGFLIINDRLRNRVLDTKKDEYEIRNNLMATSIVKFDASVLKIGLDEAKREVAFNKLQNLIINNFGIVYQKMLDMTDSVKSDVNVFIDQLRSELEIAEKQINKEPNTVTFVDVEKHVNVETPVTKISIEDDMDSDKEDSKIGNVFPFNFDVLDTIKKPFTKKPEPVLSETDKLKEKWSVMSNDKLMQLYTCYVNESIQEMNKNGTYGTSHDYALIIFDIIQSRKTDYMESK